MVKLSWEDIEKITDELASKIKAAGFMPDYLVGITTGGLIPLYFLAKKLGDPDNIITIGATSYDKDRKKDLRILYLPKVDLAGKKVLLIDEIAETGDTLKSISEILKKPVWRGRAQDRHARREQGQVRILSRFLRRRGTGRLDGVPVGKG